MNIYLIFFSINLCMIQFLRDIRNVRGKTFAVWKIYFFITIYWITFTARCLLWAMTHCSHPTFRLYLTKIKSREQINFWDISFQLYRHGREKCGIYRKITIGSVLRKHRFVWNLWVDFLSFVTEQLWRVFWKSDMCRLRLKILYLLHIHLFHSIPLEFMSKLLFQYCCICTIKISLVLAIYVLWYILLM